ncbi:MAG: ribbon-helix-helix domain-containing protein [Bacillota bacterium]|jgi:hypothetical protein
MDLRRKQIYLSAELDEHLGRLALATGRSESFIIREALAEYVERAAREAGREGNPLAELLTLSVACEAMDGSDEHDRDLYSEPGAPEACIGRDGGGGCARCEP